MAIMFCFQETKSFEEKVRDCLENNNVSNDNVCDKNKIDTKLSQTIVRAEQVNLRYLNKTTKNIGTFTVLKNESFVSSLIHKNIFLPVNHCMEYA